MMSDVRTFRYVLCGQDTSSTCAASRFNSADFTTSPRAGGVANFRPSNRTLLDPVIHNHKEVRASNQTKQKWNLGREASSAPAAKTISLIQTHTLKTLVLSSRCVDQQLSSSPRQQLVLQCLRIPQMQWHWSLAGPPPSPPAQAQSLLPITLRHRPFLAQHYSHDPAQSLEIRSQ